MSCYYDVDGEQFVSVTTVTELVKDVEPFKKWAAQCAVDHIKDVGFNLIGGDGKFKWWGVPLDSIEQAATAYKTASNKALGIGGEVHALIEKYIKNQDTAMSYSCPESESAYKAFLSWEGKNIQKWVSSELVLAHPDHCYAGTCDAIAICNDGKVMLIDFKTSKAFYDDEMGMQVAAYALAYTKKTGEVVDEIGVLRLDKITGTPFYKSYTKKRKVYEKSFLLLLDYYYTIKKRRLKNRRTIVC